MITVFFMGGPYMWVLLILAIVIIGLSIKKINDLYFKTETNQLLLENGINAILFWGCMSALIGFLAHYQGVYNAMQAISRARDISPAVVSMGYGQSLITILFGLLNLLIGSIIWFVLRGKYIKSLNSSPA